MPQKIRKTHPNRLQKPKIVVPIHFPSHRINVQIAHHRIVSGNAGEGRTGGQKGTKVQLFGHQNERNALHQRSGFIQSWKTYQKKSLLKENTLISSHSFSMASSLQIQRAAKNWL